LGYCYLGLQSFQGTFDAGQVPGFIIEHSYQDNLIRFSIGIFTSLKNLSIRAKRVNLINSLL
jgi:hypothetical protein